MIQGYGTWAAVGIRSAKKKTVLPPPVKPHAHHVAVVARHTNQFDAGNNLGVSVEQMTTAPIFPWA